MRSLTQAILVVGLLSLAGPQSAPAADWPQWRGPDRDGHLRGFVAPTAWPKELARQWSVEVGEGHSGPVVAGQQIFVLSRQGDKEVARALALTDGRELWSASYPAPYKPSPYAGSHGKWPRATPLVADGRLVTVGVSSIVSCWATETGKPLWRRDFSKEFKEPSAIFYGASVSPILVDGLIVVFVGVSGDGALLALDPATGETRWKWADDGPGYSSPIVARLAETRQVILQSQNLCLAVSPKGNLLWSLPFKTEYDQNIITPVVVGERVIFSGLQSGTTAYEVGQTEGKLTPKQVWHNRDISMYMSTPVVVGGHVYGLSPRNKGQFFCLDATNGKTLWTGDGRMGENAVLLAAGDAILALTTSSELIVFRANPERFETVSRYKVAETPTWAQPAIDGRQILVKDRSQLISWALEK